MRAATVNARVRRCDDFQPAARWLGRCCRWLERRCCSSTTTAHIVKLEKLTVSGQAQGVFRVQMKIMMVA